MPAPDILKAESSILGNLKKMIFENKSLDKFQQYRMFICFV
jgi:hypothetical protein